MSDRVKPSILIVEGNGAAFDDLRTCLEGRFVLESAATCESAITVLHRDKDAFALVMLCCPLADMSLDEALGHVTTDPLLMHIPVIVLSEDWTEGVHALCHGAMDFIGMPCHMPEMILARTRHAIEVSNNQSIIRSVERDQLTGLYNKDFFFNYANQFDVFHKELEMDCIEVDISHFHLINEKYGRNYGDDVLCSIGRRLKECVDADGGLVCRRDGDTFLIYCPHREDYESILHKATLGMGSRIRLRMGVYPRVDKTMDMERRFDRAKQAADTLRNNFNRNVAIYDDELQKAELFFEQLLEDFPRAIMEKEFVVYYQPKFAIQSTIPVLNSAEALVRWKHPTLGMISPGNFIPLFENNGLITRLDSFVWEEVAAQMKEWKDRLGVRVPVSVNVSRVDIFDNDLVGHMLRLIRKYDISPDEFLLEITESAYTQDSGQIIRTVNALRDKGFRVEIDDFGSGYSSLNMISTLPMDALKIDMEFMRNAFKERKNTKMLDAVIDIAYSLEVPTIAEGVETAEQMFTLKEMGCDVVQGFYFSRPLPAEDFERYLKEREMGWTQAAERDPKIKPAEQFAYEALHDPMTGLYNHSAYTMLLKDADQRNIALILADIDGFTEYKQANGDAAGRLALHLVAEVLKHNFRSVDFICHIGEDEFAVIMTRVNNELKPLIYEKVNRINTMIHQHEEVPPFRLSVGVAFADRENPQGDIFHDADIALQRIKAMKNSGVAIF